MNGLQVTNRLNRDTKMLSQMEGYQDWVQMKELTILALSHLLNANVDAGLKYSLAMGYDDDQETRTAFIQVLTNILNQGTEFETLAENVMTERYEKLIDVSLLNRIGFRLTQKKKLIPFKKKKKKDAGRCRYGNINVLV
jgi:neurofibromin 1